MEDLEIVFDPLPPDPLRQYITNHVSAFGIARTGVDAWHPIGFFLKNGRGEWLGGLLGGAWGGWMNVQFLWLAEEARGRRHQIFPPQAARPILTCETACSGT